MTISYSGEVANGSSFGSFWKILWKVRGSVYKLVWRELLVFLCLYYAINLTYRYGLNEGQQKTFERLRKYFESQSETIPMSFVLGFYVSLVVKRFFEQHRLLPWPDTLAIFISAAIPGNHEMGRLMRRNIMRYMMLSYVITMQQISLRVKKRFPSWNHLVDAGLVLESERKIFEIMDSKSPMSKYWMPLVWATNIINRARKEGLITSDQIVQTLLMELSDIRRRLSSLIGYDNVCVPLVYTQVVTLVLYSYFFSALMGRQMVPVPMSADDSTNNIHEDPNLYFPLFTVLQFCFYVGWLKVAEVLINPFGEDDDDLELNWLIDRHIKASYMIVDEMHEEHPELLRDQYFEEVVPKDLPYTVAAEHYRREEPKGSAEHYKVKESEALYSNLERKSLHDVYYESIDTPMVERRKGRFSRQTNRLGSGRSSSTTYSGLFGVNRMNFLYSKSEKDRIKINNKKDKKGSRSSDTYLDPNVFRDEHFNRPKIPIPDNKKENNNNRSFDDHHPSSERKSSIASDVAVAAHQMATLILSPIKETDISRKSSPQKQNGDIPKQVNLQFNVQSAQVPNSFVILPTSNGVNSVSTISATIPLALSTVPEHTGNGAIITELPVDNLDNAEFQSTNEKLVHSINSYKHKTLENTRSTPPSISSLSTYSSQSQPRVLHRTTSAPKKSEVYV